MLAGRTASDILDRSYSGRVVAAAIVIAAAIPIVAGTLFHLDWIASWKLIGLPAALPPFFDLRVITDYAASCAASGESFPFMDCAYRKRFNYPPVWLFLGQLGLGPQHIVALALAIELPALILLVVLLRGHSTRMGLLALPIILSPSIALGFERGNIDLLEWSLVCLAALLYNERRWPRAVVAGLLLVTGVLIKFLAAFCAAIAIRLTRWSIALAGLLGAFTVFYVWIVAETLAPIRQITPVTPYVSYGYKIIFDRIEFLYAPRLGLNAAGLTDSWIPTASVALFLLGAVAIAFIAWTRGRSFCRIADNNYAGTAFLFGAGIFWGTFLLLGTHFAYRLVFLLLCLPQLFRWAENRTDATTRRIGYALLGCFVISMWLKFRPEYTLHVNQLTDWLIFGVLSAILTWNGLDSIRRQTGWIAQPGVRP